MTLLAVSAQRMVGCRNEPGAGARPLTAAAPPVASGSGEEVAAAEVAAAEHTAAGRSQTQMRPSSAQLARRPSTFGFQLRPHLRPQSTQVACRKR